MAEETILSPQPDWKIAVWGAAQAGKTAFVASLHLAKCPGWAIRVSGAGFHESFMGDMQANRAPKATGEGASFSVICTFRRLGDDGSSESVSVQIEDRAGEDWEKAANGLPVGLDTLAASHAAVLLYDISPEKQSDHANVDRLSNICDVIYNLWKEKGTKGPLAVCFAKCDQKLFDPVKIEAARQDPERILEEEILPGSRFSDIAREYRGTFGKDNVRFFPVSSFGVRMVYGSAAPVIFYDESFRLRLVTGTPEARRDWPINLTEPFLWIFDRLGIGKNSVV